MPIDGDPAEAAEAEAARLEARYPREHLGRLAYVGGFEADIVDDEVPQSELLALEELDDENDTPD